MMSLESMQNQTNFFHYTYFYDGKCSEEEFEVRVI